MKILNIFTLFLVLLGFSACETYDDNPDVDYSSVAKMSGEWRIQVKNVNTGEKVVISTSSAGVPNYKTTIYTYNTADESTTQMWLRIGSASAPVAGAAKFGVKGKVDINLSNKTFTATGGDNTYAKGGIFNISNGTIVLDGADTPSGYKSDAISFTITSDLDPGVTYEITGYRRTGWPEDE